MNSDETLANRIKKWRREERLSQQELAAFLGVSQRTVSRWERGVDQPSLALVERLSCLIEGEGDQNMPSIFDAIANSAMPLALIDGKGRVLVASPRFPQENLPVAQDADRQPAVLIVEDDLAVLKTTRAILKRWRFLSIGTYEGEEAVSLISSGDLKPNAALIDFKLPGALDGVDTALALKCYIPDLPVLIVTGEGSPENMRKIANSQLTVITKPVDPQQLLLALKAMLANKSG